MLMSRPRVRSRKNQRPAVPAVPVCRFRLAKKAAAAPFAVLGIQNRHTCGDPMGLALPQPVPASEEIASDRYRGMGSQSHWAVPLVTRRVRHCA
jgi:hypothetical protein